MMIKKVVYIITIFILFAIELQGHFHPERNEPPVFTKGLYINAYRAGDRKYMKKLLNDFGSLINTLVIDIKDSHGTLTYKSRLKIVRKVGSQGALIKDMRQYVKDLKNRGYYLVGRIVVFRDPLFARYKGRKFGVKVSGTRKLFRDENGFVWVDPFSEEAWEYNIAIAAEAAKAGFDEIQFDYVRFPSTDGNSIPYFPFHKKRKKEEAILSFLSMAKERLKREGVKVSIAVFGYTTWHNHLPREGQHFYEMGSKVDIVYPILYPSHFADGFLANKHKEKRTYNIVFKSIKRGDSLLRYTDSKLIAYLQGFNWKRSRLGRNYIGIQMSAAEEAGSNGWIVWNAKGEYKETYLSLVNRTIKLQEPEGKPRIKDVKLTFLKNEDKSEKPDTRGIEAILHW